MDGERRRRSTTRRGSASSSAPASAASRCWRPARASSRPAAPTASRRTSSARCSSTRRRATSPPTSASAAPTSRWSPPAPRAPTPSARRPRSCAAATPTAILAGGVEACITELILGGFCNMRALGSPRDPDDPASASRPFDATRDGFIVGEGAAVVVLEREDDARARGAPIVAEVVGYGASNDAFHIAHPHPEGVGVVEMMREALERAGVRAEEVGYINAHGTSTPLNDSAETAAIRTVFGAHADRLAVSSTKSMTGHLFGAAGALETAVCALGAARRHRAADDQPAGARPGVRPRLRRPRARAGCPTCATRSPTPWASAATTAARSSPVSSLGRRRAAGARGRVRAGDGRLRPRPGLRHRAGRPAADRARRS